MSSHWAVLTVAVAPWTEIQPRIGEHVDYQERLMAAGHLVASGPFLPGAGHGPGAGLTLLVADTLEQAEALATGDPLVQAGLRAVTVRQWRLAQVASDVAMRA